MLPTVTRCESRAAIQTPDPTTQTGVALIIVLLSMAALSALAMSLTLITATERHVVAFYRYGLEALYGAEGALERVLPDLAAESDVSMAFAGLAPSSFVDGPPGPRTLPDGTFIDLRTLTSMLNCMKAACSEADLIAESEDRPWGHNNPRWQLYAYGLLPAVRPDAAPSRLYAVVWIADDPGETDLDPLIDGGPDEARDNPGRGRLTLRAHAYGPGNTHRALEATVVKTGRTIRVISWREVR
jgi:hypothetical protein